MNTWNGIGRLTRDVDYKVSPSTGNGLARFTVAVDRPPTKEGERKADYISCVCFGKTAETASKWLGKGRLVGITGRIQTGSYEKDGKKVYTTDVLVERFDFLDYADKDKKKPEEGDQISGFTEMNDEDVPF